MSALLSRFWIAVVRSLVHLPLGARNVLARVVAFILWWAVPSRRHIALTNLRLCFPDKSPAERRHIARRNYFWLARAALDHGVLWRGSREQVSALVRFEGLDLVEKVAREKIPTIVIAPHFAGLDAAGIAFNLHIRGVSIYQVQRNSLWDQATLEGRSRFCAPVLIPKTSHSGNLRQVIRAMREGLPFYYLPDMDFGARDALFVPFFGVPAATLSFCGRLAAVTKSQILFCVTEATMDGYVVHISDPWEGYPSGDDWADTARVMAATEDWARRLPEQYLWTHRRFKTRPPGEPPVY